MHAHFLGGKIQKSKLGCVKNLEEFELYLPVIRQRDLKRNLKGYLLLYVSHPTMITVVDEASAQQTTEDVNLNKKHVRLHFN